MNAPGFTAEVCLAKAGKSYSNEVPDISIPSSILVPAAECFNTTERYWGWCKKWWGGYPCRKTRRVYNCCYNFSKVIRHGWGVYCRYWGCEGGKQYYWTSFCMKFGSATLYNRRYCRNNALKQSGTC